jgi:3-phosphoshikimate 1-carboxyvinyltransferase
MNTNMKSSKSTSLSGHIKVPGDKSISHRSLMFGAIAEGETLIYGLLRSGDVMSTARALREMGAKITDRQDGSWSVEGVGSDGLSTPDIPLDMGNSGTSVRLLMGLVAGYNITADFVGDASLSKRPMGRVIDPLTTMGATFKASDGGRLPLTITGTSDIQPITYKLPVASAQVKSALLLAGLCAKGMSTITELEPTRDYTESMLKAFGVDVQTDGLDVTLEGGQSLEGCAIDVPADPSSAAFPTVAALVCEGSKLRLDNIGMNERRCGLYETLIEMGADITVQQERIQGGEKVADLLVKSSAMKGITVPVDRVPSMIDEFPIFAVAASCATGTTIMHGLAELRVKESDRLGIMAKGLVACGVKLEEGDDSLIIHGTGMPPKGGVSIETALDHRIAMSFLVLGLVSDEPIVIDDSEPILTSFPNFIEGMNDLGANIHPDGEDSDDAFTLSLDEIKHL